MRYGRHGVAFSPGASHALLCHPWPGNVRELKHTVERAILMCHGSEIDVEDLGLRQGAGNTLPLEDLELAQVERLLVERALELHDGNVSRAARKLGLSRSALYRRIRQYQIGRPR